MGPRKKGTSGSVPTDHAGSTEDVFIKITDALEDSDYAKALRLADAVLKRSKADQDALKVKLFALLMIGRFEEVLVLINSSKALQEQRMFEHAYCLYKQGDLETAIKLLSASDDEATLQLTALVHMRAGQAQQAAEVYSRLAPKVVADKQSANELATNTVAALVLSGQRDRILSALEQLRVKDRDSLEVALNMACAAVLNGELDRATKLLLLAETKGNETLIEENATQAEMDQELGPIHAQAAFISLLRGDAQGAYKAFSTLVKQPVGRALQAVCTNNMVCLRAMQHDIVAKNKLPQDAAQAVSFPSPKGPEQQYVSANTRMQEARRKLAPFVDTHTGAITQALAQRLPQAAQASVRHNHALAGVLGAVGSGGRPGPSGTGISQTCAAAQALLQEMPDLEDGLLLHAVATGSLHSSDQGIKVVKTWLQDHPSAEATHAALMGAHIASSAQPPKLETALSFLTHPRLADNVKHAPAVLATRALLRERLARPQAAQQSGQELQAAIGWWTDQAASSKRTEALVACNEQQAVLLMRTGDSQGALQSLKTLKDGMSQHGTATAHVRVARMLAAVDSAAAAEFVLSVAPSQPRQTVSVKEAEELEISSILSKGTSVLLGPYVRGSGSAPGHGNRPQRKRKRKPRYPKKFDPENPGPQPDPERWLPWHERAANKRRRRRKGNAPISKGAQGMGAVDDSLDKSHITVEDLDAKAKQTAGPRVPPRNAKGKRKGKR